VEKRADHRSELVWVNGEAGYQTIDLRTFDANLEKLTVGLIPTVGSGPAVGVGAGVRLLFLTIGPRARVGFFHDDSATRTVSDWQFWTLDAELGLRIPIGRLEPNVTLAGGYATVGSLDDAVAGLRGGLVQIHGANARAGVGLDYYVARHITLGAALTGGLLFLSRPGVPIKELAQPQKVGTINEAKARLLEANGSSVGSSLTLTGGAGLHF
jgi:hypothetical protein